MHEKNPLQQFCGSNVKNEITRVFYVEARLKKSQLPINYIYSSFSTFILPPLVECYMNDNDES